MKPGEKITGAEKLGDIRGITAEKCDALISLEHTDGTRLEKLWLISRMKLHIRPDCPLRSIEVHAFENKQGGGELVLHPK